MSLDQTAQKFRSLVDSLPRTDHPTQRDFSQITEAWQTYGDYLDELGDALANGEIKIDESIDVVIEGVTIKFKNINEYAEWLVERNYD